MVFGISGFIQWLKRRFFIPGEPIIILGFEHNGAAFRLIDGWVRYPSGLAKNTFKDESGDIKPAKPLLLMKPIVAPDGLLTRVGKLLTKRTITTKTIKTESLTESEPIITETVNVKVEYEESNVPFAADDGTYLLRVDPAHAIILDNAERPEGLAFPMDMDTASGLWLDRKCRKRSEQRMLPTGVNKLVLDPVLQYFRTTPELYGVAADVALSAGLLRVKVQWWKTLILMFIAFLFGMIFKF